LALWKIALFFKAYYLKYYHKKMLLSRNGSGMVPEVPLEVAEKFIFFLKSPSSPLLKKKAITLLGGF